MYQRKPQGIFKHWDFAVLDIVALMCSYSIAYIVRRGADKLFTDSVSINAALLLIVVLFIGFFTINPYKDILHRGHLRELLSAFKLASFVLVFSVFVLFALKKGAAYSRLTTVMTAGVFCVISFIVRELWKIWLKNRNNIRQTLVIFTSADTYKSILEDIRDYRYVGSHIQGLVFVDDTDIEKVKAEIEAADDLDSDLRVLTYGDDTYNKILRGWVDEIYFDMADSNYIANETLEQLADMGITFHLRVRLPQAMKEQKYFLEKFAGHNTVTSSNNYLTFKQAFIKRATDIAGGLVGSVFTLLLTVIIGPIIFIKSPGPIFFSQIRVGKNGKKFKIYKFRSMYMDAEERKAGLMAENRIQDGMMFKLDFDPRIIGAKKLPDGTIKKGIGNRIRDWSLDEFPQFFNVLKGDMSLVGTRPPTIDEWDKYTPHHRSRLTIKPGITGLWQVSGRSKITDFDEVVKLDRQYIAEWSLGNDVRILLKTIKVVLKNDGAM